ncbi:cellulase family glycosylhydrolase [Raoultella planticola]|nr:cellulase family glycosylhydrolase [Raoultella planticola]
MLKYIFLPFVFCFLFNSLFFLTYAAEIKCNSDADITLGVNDHLANQSTEYVDTSINKMKSLGIKIVRFDASWKFVEDKKGEYGIPEKWDQLISKLNHNSIEPLIILDYGNKYYNNGDKPISDSDIDAFKRYVTFLVKHFKGKVRYYQIWNEWNGKVGNTTPGDVDGYKKLVKSVYPVIKQIDPNSLVIVSSFSSAEFNKMLGIGHEDYLRSFLTPDMADFTDILSIHPYTIYRRPPYNGYDTYMRQVDYAVNLINSNPLFNKKPLFITEIGWSTSSGKIGVTEDEQKEYIDRAISYAAKEKIKAIIFYELRDASSNKFDVESNFGFFNSSWQQKSISSNMLNSKC